MVRIPSTGLVDANANVNRQARLVLTESSSLSRAASKRAPSPTRAQAETPLLPALALPDMRDNFVGGWPAVFNDLDLSRARLL